MISANFFRETLRLPLCSNAIRSKSFSSKPEWQQPSGVDTGIAVYNCILKNKVPLYLNNNVATWYSCGPTVYDSAHIGHASCYVKLDIIQKILRNYFKINLITSMGVTDIDDKIIKRSNETNISTKDVAVKYELEFWKNMSELGVSMPQMICRVTDHIPVIKEFIQKIMDKNLCYKTPDNSVYFDTKLYGNYGKLRNAQHLDEELDSFIKKSMSDFALWKSHKPGEVYWESEWGDGRPGWHIECSAMASRLFNGVLDFHGGGIDLQFPHHENEEAQSCAYHNSKQWVNYWLHTGHLHLKGDVKMSKSLKNTVSIDDLLKSHNAATFRMACLLSHYRYSMEYSEEMMTTAKALIVKFKSCLEDCKNYMNQQNVLSVIDEPKLLFQLQSAKEEVDQALKDDFDTSKCITSLIKLISDLNKMLRNKSKSGNVVFRPVGVGLTSEYIAKTMNSFGIDLHKSPMENETSVSDIIDSLVKFRNVVRIRARETKDKTLLAECDNVRNSLKTYNVKVNDNADTQSSSWIYAE